MYCHSMNQNYKYYLYLLLTNQQKHVAVILTACSCKLVVMCHLKGIEKLHAWSIQRTLVINFSTRKALTHFVE